MSTHPSGQNTYRHVSPDNESNYIFTLITMKRCVIDNVIYMFEMELNLIKCFYYISFYFYHNANAYEFHV